MKGLPGKYIDIIKNSVFLRSVSVLISGQFLSQFITFITIPIVSRLYSEQDFGEFAIFISTANIIFGIGPIGLTSAIMAPKELQRTKEVFFTAWAIEISVFSLFFVAAILIAPFFHFYNISLSYYIAIILCYIYLIFFGSSLLLSTYVNRLKRNRILFWNSIISGLCILLITIPLGYFGFGVLGLIIAGICSTLASSIQMLVKANPFQKILNFKEMASVCKEFKDYILFQFPSNWLNIFTRQLPNQMFSAHYGNVALGGYAMSERALGYPVSLVAGPIGTIYFRHATQFVHEDKLNELGKFTYTFITRILKIAFIPTIVFMIYSEEVFSFALGSNWGTAGLIASILAIQYVFKFCEQCITYCLVVLGKQKVNLVVSIVNFIIIGTALFIGILFFDTIIETIICFAIGSCFAQMLNISLDFYYLGIRVSKIIFTFLMFALGGAALVIGINYFVLS